MERTSENEGNIFWFMKKNEKPVVREKGADGVSEVVGWAGLKANLSVGKVGGYIFLGLVDTKTYKTQRVHRH